MHTPSNMFTDESRVTLDQTKSNTVFGWGEEEKREERDKLLHYVGFYWGRDKMRLEEKKREKRKEKRELFFYLCLINNFKKEKFT